jgi:hypothetical protein
MGEGKRGKEKEMPVSEKYDYYCNGVPNNGTSAVQTLTIGGTPTGGTFQLEFGGQITGDISWSATDATLVSNIDTALEALSNIGAGDVTVADSTLTNGIGNATITFGANLKNLNVPLIQVEENALTGTDTTIAVTATTPGVTATARIAAANATLFDAVNGEKYVNNGASLAPVWVNFD